MKSMEAKVRAFVVLCALILSATVYYVSYVRFKGARVRFRTYLKDAEGIEPGTQVLFGGITVGKVTSRPRPDRPDSNCNFAGCDAGHTLEREVCRSRWICQPDGRAGFGHRYRFE